MQIQSQKLQRYQEFPKYLFRRKPAFKELNEIVFNPLNAELNPICHLLALLGTHHIFHVSGLRVNSQFV
jgi:hypothetical protein